jgi:hypothetical protein
MASCNKLRAGDYWNSLSEPELRVGPKGSMHRLKFRRVYTQCGVVRGGVNMCRMHMLVEDCLLLNITNNNQSLFVKL